MNQHIFKDILENHMEPFSDENMPLKWTFMYVDRSFGVLKCPAQSPDHNPIEKIWNDTEKNVKVKKLLILNELWEAVNQAFV